MSQKTCSHCGAPVEAGRRVCPNCHTVLKHKSPLTPYLIIAVLAVVVIAAVALLLLFPAPAPSAESIASVPAVSPAGSAGAVSVPSTPACTIAIAGSRAGSSLRLQVMTSTCAAGEVTSLRVSVNGASAGTLAPTAGSGGTFTGTAGTNNVIVTAKFTNGAEKVMYQNPAL